MNDSKFDRPTVYFARAMDGLEEMTIRKFALQVRRKLDQAGLAMVDTYAAIDRASLLADPELASSRIVESDLALMRKCDAIAIDMSLPLRNYIGCSCEMVYARLFSLPVVVNVGNTDNGTRYWLKYHATEIVTTVDDMVTGLVRILHA